VFPALAAYASGASVILRTQYPGFCHGTAKSSSSCTLLLNREPEPRKSWRPSAPAPPSRASAPQTVKSLIERLWWRNLADPTTISGLLSLVYARPVDDELLLQRILAATEHPGACCSTCCVLACARARVYVCVCVCVCVCVQVCVCGWQGVLMC
jgi:hypothetical protein